VPGVTSFALRNNADNANNVVISDAGQVTIRDNLLFVSDNAKDIGGSGAARPANIYYGTRVFGVGGEPTQKAPVTGFCTSNYQLTTSYADVTGCSIALTIGRWVVIGVMETAEVGAGDVGHVAVAKIVVATGSATITNSGALCVTSLQAANQVDQGTQAWAVQVTSSATIQMQALKSAGATGTSSVNTPHTTLTAVYAGNDV
jgi:hypothetical protein